MSAEERDTTVRLSATSIVAEPMGPGRALIAALAAQDRTRIEACLRPNLRFRALVPAGLRERVGAPEAARLLHSWFAEAERVEIHEQEVVPFGGRLYLKYRFRERYPDGDSDVIEQNAFADVEEGQIGALDLVCSGHLPEPRMTGLATHRFDAEEMGCGSGLPQEFRRRILAIPVGSRLEVITRDPAAREDLPSLARLQGHHVISVNPSDNGTTVVTVERRC